MTATTTRAASEQTGVAGVDGAGLLDQVLLGSLADIVEGATAPITEAPAPDFLGAAAETIAATSPTAAQPTADAMPASAKAIEDALMALAIAALTSIGPVSDADKTAVAALLKTLAPTETIATELAAFKASQSGQLSVTDIIAKATPVITGVAGAMKAATTAKKQAEEVIATASAKQVHSFADLLDYI